MGEAVNGVEMKEESRILVFAYPKQGHMSPMLQFSKRLISKGLPVTFLITSTATQTIQLNLPSPSFSSLDVQVISDVPDDGDVPSTLEEIFRSFEATVSRNFVDFVDKFRSRSENRAKLVVYDSVMPWIFDLATKLGLDAAPFFTQSAAVNHILHHVQRGILKIPVLEKSSVVSIPSLPGLEVGDLPSFPFKKEVVVKFMTDQFSNFENAKWIFFNTFDQLESEVLNWMTHKWPIKTIGPTVPSAYMDGRLVEDKTYGLESLNSIEEEGKSYLEWLDSKEINSVIYISFGSIALLKELQVMELAQYLLQTKLSFLLALREVEKLPPNFVEQTLNRGLVVNWCNQLEVLSHKSVSCFVTHCGWNSTMEALSIGGGLPMVAIPQWIDQVTNAKFVADVWKIGVRVKLNDEGIATKEEIEASIKQVFEGGRRNEIRQNSIKWKKLARQAVDEGGSSDKNIQEFVRTITST